MSELVLHDVGNERRFVFLIPAFVALASLAIARDRRWLDERIGGVPLTRALLAAPVVVASVYLLAGSLLRVAFLDELHANVFRSTVRSSAGRGQSP